MFSKKKHYEDLLLQHQLDENKFKKADRAHRWNIQRHSEKLEDKFDKQCARERKPPPRHCHHLSDE